LLFDILIVAYIAFIYSQRNKFIAISYKPTCQWKNVAKHKAWSIFEFLLLQVIFINFYVFIFTNKEKAKAIDCIIEDQDNSSNDIQGSEEENQQQRQYDGAAAATTTTNQTF
jgi:hypothetical protein